MTYLCESVYLRLGYIIDKTVYLFQYVRPCMVLNIDDTCLATIDLRCPYGF